MTSNTNGGLSGLVNLGNTCYMNSAIQCLSQTNLLSEYFISKKFVNDYNQNSKTCNLAKEWYRLLIGLHEENCIVSPKSFYKTIIFLSNKVGLNFGYGNQNDVQEFLVFFIDSLHESVSKEVSITISGEIKNEIDKMALDAMTNWKNYFKNSYSKIIQLFYGQMVTRIMVGNKVMSTNYSPICFFTLPIPNKKDIDIYDCLNLFTQTELLEDENMWQDDKGVKHNAKKKIDIWDFPNILIISINRFDNNGSKKNNFVSFPIDNLDLSKYCVGYNKYKSTFELYGICNHIGNSNNGHYFSYCRYNDGNWYEFNDTNVTKIDSNNIISNKCYCLFYKKRNLNIN